MIMCQSQGEGEQGCPGAPERISQALSPVTVIAETL